MRLPVWIRKFGVEFCDLPTMIANVDVFLRVLTLRVDTRNEKPVLPLFYLVTLVITISYLYVYLISMAVFVYACSLTGEVLPALIVFSLGMSSEIATTKLAFLFVYEDKARAIVSGCLASDALVIPGSRFSNNLATTLRVVKRRAILFWCVLIANGILYIVQPLILPGRHLMEDNFPLFGLEPRFESPNYEVAFSVMAMGVIFTVYIPANITAFLIITTGYIEAQMLAWSEELLQLWDDAENGYQTFFATTNIIGSISEGYNDSRNESIRKDQAMNKIIRKRLITIAIGHSKNVQIMAQVEGVFRTAIAAEFSLLGVALIAELLGGLENTYMEIPYALSQVAMDCLTGQRLRDASAVFERAVYACHWEWLEPSNMRLVLVMLRNSQKPLRLSAGGITTLDFTSLMSVLNSIFSAYTTLRSTMNKHE